MKYPNGMEMYICLEAIRIDDRKLLEIEILRRPCGTVHREVASNCSFLEWTMRYCNDSWDSDPSVSWSHEVGFR